MKTEEVDPGWKICCWAGRSDLQKREEIDGQVKKLTRTYRRNNQQN
jgi:hypothetical protein